MCSEHLFNLLYEIQILKLIKITNISYKKFFIIYSHSVIWWRTRCNALEHENKLLRDKIRNLLSTNHPPKQYLQTFNCQSTSSCPQTIFQTPQAALNHEPVRNSEVKEKDDEEDLVFQMNDDMMKFLEQSMRHKRELKKMREESKKNEDMIECDDSKVEHDSARDWVQKRIKCAKLLYGEACSRILAMETALQATNERHVDKAKPQFWPNIPLNIKFN